MQRLKRLFPKPILVILLFLAILLTASTVSAQMKDMSKADDTVGFPGFFLSGQADSATSVGKFPSGGEPLKPVVIYPDKADVSPPLSSIPYTIEDPGDEIRVMPDLNPPQVNHPDIPFVADPVVQDGFGSEMIPSPSIDWEAINNLCGCLPPDTNGDVGPSHYVQTVNVHFAVYNKTGTLLMGPLPMNTIWSGFGGVCEADNSGDPVVVYDHLADRWVMTQFAVTTGTHECIAISQTSDPTGAYYRYAFNIGGFPDYPKVGVWIDSYLATYRNFGAEFDMQAAAYNRAKMLVGDPSAEALLFSMSAAFDPIGIDGFLPADLDGAAPPAGTDAPFMGLLPDENGFPEDALAMFNLDVDWSDPGSATLYGPTVLPVEPFAHNLCDGDRNCIPQPDTAQGLDAIADRILHRLVYRDFGYYQAIVTVHTVNAGTEENELAGERWYELRNAGGGWGVYQQGTYAPDNNNRWMGSIAMDDVGNIALGYSVSSETVYPSIRYTGRLVTDPLGTMPQGEGEIIAGTGSQTHSAARWGDYSAMSIDPVDGCTFWYTTEYIETTGTSPWQTRVGAFAFDECPSPAFDDFSVWALPETADICTPDSAVFDVTAFQIGSYSDSVTLSTNGVPAGYSASFGANPVVPPATSLMTLSNTGSATAGQYEIDVVGMGPTSTHTSTVTLNLFTAAPIATTLVSPADGAINQSVRPVLKWNTGSLTTEYLVEVATDAGFTNIVDSATVEGTSYQVSINLDLNTEYFWRVATINTCGTGAYSSARSFTVVGDGSTCPAGMTFVNDYMEDFDSGAAGWTHSALTGPDTWALQNSNPSPGSGSFNYHADDFGSPSEQLLVSPAIVLPSGATQLTMQFLNYQSFENPSGSGGCWDGGTLEVSNDGGSNWTVMDAELLSDPYDGYGNNGPPAGRHMWCGETGGVQPWLNSIVDMSAYDGQSVQFRFSMLTDAAASAPGWNIDDLMIAHCENMYDGPLQTNGIRLNARTMGSRARVRGIVRVVDGDVNPVAGATVEIEWSLPGGGTVIQSAVTGANGLARFAVIDDLGTYTLTVTDVTFADGVWTGGPIFMKSITVP
jgi:hypothetical protein